MTFQLHRSAKTSPARTRKRASASGRKGAARLRESCHLNAIPTLHHIRQLMGPELRSDSIDCFSQFESPLAHHCQRVT